MKSSGQSMPKTILSIPESFPELCSYERGQSIVVTSVYLRAWVGLPQFSHLPAVDLNNFLCKMELMIEFL